jgi:hypothetical protein
MSDSSKKKDENSEVRDNVEPVSLSQGQVQESHALNSSSNSLKKSMRGNKIEKKEKKKKKKVILNMMMYMW